MHDMVTTEAAGKDQPDACEEDDGDAPQGERGKATTILYIYIYIYMFTWFIN